MVLYHGNRKVTRETDRYIQTYIYKFTIKSKKKKKLAQFSRIFLCYALTRYPDIFLPNKTGCITQAASQVISSLKMHVYYAVPGQMKKNLALPFYSPIKSCCLDIPNCFFNKHFRSGCSLPSALYTALTNTS